MSTTKLYAVVTSSVGDTIIYSVFGDSGEPMFDARLSANVVDALDGEPHAAITARAAKLTGMRLGDFSVIFVDSIRVGDQVIIYTDPISRTHPEGEARIERVLTKDRLGWYLEVKFKDARDGETFTRFVKDDALNR